MTIVPMMNHETDENTRKENTATRIRCEFTGLAQEAVGPADVFPNASFFPRLPNVQWLLMP
jgi:hypothetical protein